jgi:hypothetical protein
MSASTAEAAVASASPSVTTATRVHGKANYGNHGSRNGSNCYNKFSFHFPDPPCLILPCYQAVTALIGLCVF